ncbi:hypothetical protein HAX54_016821 [Datura stramonium]|uniref:Uncharacterized protein n=1 Tax=Datura stramonium TaxID=4076 RepID=A0ABS8UJN8_DATST|nr:hypothetical protein [Datura stramonium]
MDRITKHNHAWRGGDQSGGINVGTPLLSQLMKENPDHDQIMASNATNIPILTKKLIKVEVKKDNGDLNHKVKVNTTRGMIMVVQVKEWSDAFLKNLMEIVGSQTTSIQMLEQQCKAIVTRSGKTIQPIGGEVMDDVIDKYTKFVHEGVNQNEGWMKPCVSESLDDGVKKSLIDEIVQDGAVASKRQ